MLIFPFLQLLRKNICKCYKNNHNYNCVNMVIFVIIYKCKNHKFHSYSTTKERVVLWHPKTIFRRSDGLIFNRRPKDIHLCISRRRIIFLVRRIFFFALYNNHHELALTNQRFKISKSWKRVLLFYPSSFCSPSRYALAHTRPVLPTVDP